MSESPRDLRFAIIGAGMAGILSAIKLQRGRPHRLHDLREGRPARRHVAREHLPGPRVRRAVAPLQLLVRAEPRVEPPLLAGRRDPRLLREGRGRPRCRRRTSGSATGSSAASTPTAGGASRRPQGRHGRGRRRDRRDRGAAPSAPARHRRRRHVRRCLLPQRALGPRRFRSTAKRVGVIGTGSTAVQIVSAIVDEVAQLSLFQRTAQWIMPQENPAYTEEQKAAYRADSDAARGDARAPRRDVRHVRPRGRRRGLAADQDDRGDVPRRTSRRASRDPELRERLRPDYRAACKRLVVSPDFYDAIQQPNAELVTEGIERIEPEGVRTRDGVLHELDVLVLATGLPSERLHAPDDRHRARRSRPRRRLGRAARSRTCRSRCRASRTSSC